MQLEGVQDEEASYPWWEYTYHAGGDDIKYIIHIEWKMKEANTSSAMSGIKFGARNCTVNGKVANIELMSRFDNPYNNNEYVRLNQKGRRFHLDVR